MGKAVPGAFFKKALTNAHVRAKGHDVPLPDKSDA
jgi:hypothetical protein